MLEKFCQLEDELKQLRLEGVNVDNALSLIEDIKKELVVKD